MTKITANLLSFNEDRWIDLCIEHMYPYVDDIVVLDAGSSDDTIKILKRYDKVRYHIIPQPDIHRRCPEGWAEGDRRNVLKDMSRGDWILALGCDELLDDAVWPNLEEWLKNDKVVGYGFVRINYHYNFEWHKPINDPANGGEVRLYRNIPEIEVERRPDHNYILYKNKYIHNSSEVINTGYLIHHMHHTNVRGYRPVYDRRVDDSFINVEDLPKKGYKQTKETVYRRPITLPKILFEKGVVK